MTDEKRDTLFKEYIRTIAVNSSSPHAQKLKNKIKNLEKQDELIKFIDLLNNRIDKIKNIEEQKRLEEEKKLEKEKGLETKKKIGNYYYSLEDLYFLRDALKNKEITMLDLTEDEAYALGLGSYYRKALSSVYYRLNLTKKENEKYDEIRNSLNNKDTSLRIVLNMYKDATGREVDFSKSPKQIYDEFQKMKKSKKK